MSEVERDYQIQIGEDEFGNPIYEGIRLNFVQWVILKRIRELQTTTDTLDTNVRAIGQKLLELETKINEIHAAVVP